MQSFSKNAGTSRVEYARFINCRCQINTLQVEERCAAVFLSAWSGTSFGAPASLDAVIAAHHDVLVAM